MQTTTIQSSIGTSVTPVRTEYNYEAYQFLRWGFVILPVLAGLNKFFQLLTNWEMYLAPVIRNLLASIGVTDHAFMLAVGVSGIVAGLAVAIKPRFGAFLVAAWLIGIIVNLLLTAGFYDIALRDFGLRLGAISLGLLSRTYSV